MTCRRFGVVLALAYFVAWVGGCGSNSMPAGGGGGAGGSASDPNGNTPGSRGGTRPSDMSGGSGGGGGSGGTAGGGGGGGTVMAPDASVPADGPRPIDASPDLPTRPEAGPEVTPPPPDAAPPRPDAAPDSTPVTASLLGTKWKVMDTGAEGNSFIWEFLAGGVMRYTYLTGPLANNVYTNATWTQMGNRVTISFNNGYSTRTGTFEGDRISGTATNVTGLNWTWAGVRQ
jgi:hypothetical protein